MLAPRSLVKGRRNTITLNCKLLCVAREDERRRAAYEALLNENATEIQRIVRGET